MFNQKAIIILFINRNTFQLFGGSLTGIVTIQVPETILKDGDMLSADGAYTLIKQVVKQYQLSSSQLLIILSDLSYFEKTFPLSQSATLEDDILNFFNVVPHESIITKVYDFDKGKRAVVMNKLFYETLKQGFALQGISIKAVVPSCVIPSAKGNYTLTLPLANEMMRTAEYLSKQSLLDAQDVSQQVIRPEEITANPKKKSQLPLLLGIFGVLITILIVVVLMQPH
jgi:hypothetical protein